VSQTDTQIDTTGALIYKMEGFLLLKGDINLLLVNFTQEVSKKSFGGCYHVNQGFLFLK
jgi:hypothetical protein